MAEIVGKISLNANDFIKTLEKYKSEEVLLIVKQGQAPTLMVHGKSYPIVHLSYQYLTDGVNTGVNMLIAEYIDGPVVKHVMIDNRTGQTMYGNKYHLGD